MNVQLPLKLRLEAHTLLEDYVGNAAEQLVVLDGLIILKGDAGTGKTHLLQGLCHSAEARGDNAIYLPGLSALEPGILVGLETASLVCLDDVAEVITRRAWQEALFHLINACRDASTVLVLGNVPEDSDLSDCLPDLRSRLNAAYQVRCQQLLDDDKLDVIRRKAIRRGFDMPEEVCRFVLSRAPRDMHHLADLVMRLDEATLSRQKKVTIPFVKTALGL